MLVKDWLFVVALSLSLTTQVSAQENSDYRLSGITVYDQNELNVFARQYVYNSFGKMTAQNLADAIELIYRDDGYFLADAQVSSDGRSIIMDEGRIDQVTIEGVDEKTYSTVKKYFETIGGQNAITQREFERALMLSNDLAGVSVTTEIDYPEHLSGAHLRVLGHEVAQQAGSVTLDNPPRRLGDEISLYFVQEFYSSLVTGDLLRFQGTGSVSTGSDESNSLWGTLSYRAPVGSSGLYGELSYGNVTARRDLSGNLVQTDISGSNFTAALGYPVIRDIDRYGYFLFEIRSSDAESESLTETFVSSANVISGTFLYGSTLKSGASLEWGVNLAFGEQGSKSTNSKDGDDEFWHLRAGVGYESPMNFFSENTAWRTEIWGQYTDSRLPNVEEFYLGDRYGLRGYAFDEVDGDSGVIGVFEVSHALFPKSESIRRISPYAFVDLGFVSNNQPSSSEVENMTLVSTGVGAEAELSNSLYLNGYVGVPLKDGPLTSAGNPAAYLAISKSW